MYIKHLSLANFRNYTTAEVVLHPGINLLVGENGHGKTNLVEAVGYLSTLRSHRVAGYEALIRAVPELANSATIRVKVENQDRELLVDLEINRNASNRAMINKSAASRIRDVLGLVTSVIFAPEDVELVRGQPAGRRDFIDDLLIQLSPRFAGVIADYERVLKQRNTLLRTAKQTGAKGSALSTLDAWDQQLTKFGSELIAARISTLNKLTPLVEKNYAQIAETKSSVNILMKSSLNEKTTNLDGELDDTEVFTDSDQAAIAEIYTNRLQELRTKELERGITLIGPHRDDLLLLLNALNAKTHSSSGETWSLAIALRLASVDLLREATNTGDPILILDDVFATLDFGRRERLGKLVEANEQVIITAAVAADVPAGLSAKVFEVRNGEVFDGK